MSQSSGGFTGTMVPDRVREWAADVINAAQGMVTPFSINGYSVIPGELPMVAAALRTGVIWLGYLPPGTEFQAGYVSGGYMLIERWANKEKLLLVQSQLVHEAIHAAFDVRGGTSAFEISTFVDEGCAYTAEAMYLRRQGLLPAEAAGHKPLALGWKAATSIQNGSGVPRTIIDAFNAALTEYGYRNTPRKKAGLVPR